MVGYRQCTKSGKTGLFLALLISSKKGHCHDGLWVENWSSLSAAFWHSDVGTVYTSIAAASAGNISGTSTTATDCQRWQIGLGMATTYTYGPLGPWLAWSSCRKMSKRMACFFFSSGQSDGPVNLSALDIARWLVSDVAALCSGLSGYTRIVGVVQIKLRGRAHVSGSYAYVYCWGLYVHGLVFIFVMCKYQLNTVLLAL